MSVGIGITGRERVLTVGGSSLVGVQNKGLSFGNTRLDTTDDNAGGWSEALALSGEKSISFSIDGLMKNLELMNSFFATSQIFALTMTYPDGSVVSGDFFLDSFEETGSYNELSTFTGAFSSSGAVSFTPGT